jgi:F-type H+-transporting ATPase subunit gamma
MASLLALKKRIQTAQNVSKTTRALQMIATSKLKKAQNAALLSRPYVDKLSEVSQKITSKVDPQQLHAYMQKNTESSRPLLIFISPDKGLCGGLLTNLAREALIFESKYKPFYITVGKKAEVIASKMSKDIIGSFPLGTSLPTFDVIYPLIRIVDEYFLNKKVSHVKILTTKFVNLFTQMPVIKNILPVDIEEGITNEKNMQTLFEPNISDILPALLKQYVEMIVYQNLLETYASQQAAQTIAMKNATDNALTVIDELRLEYNKTRQEKITNEILDISGSSTMLNNE